MTAVFMEVVCVKNEDFCMFLQEQTLDELQYSFKMVEPNQILQTMILF
jgi:hypothetical protein